MDTLIGIQLPELPFILKEFEAVLLFHEYPTTVLYENADGFPIIREWADYSNETKTERFFYYRTNRLLLKRYLSGELPYSELINSNLDGYVVFEDRTVKEGSKFVLVSVKLMPVKYLPQPDFYFVTEEGVQYQQIEEYFVLDAVAISDIGLNEAKEIATEKKSETLYVHFRKGKGIGFGTANTEVLAKTLLKFDKFYKETALDYKLGAQRGEIQLTAKKNEMYLQYTSTEVYGNIAASYAVLIRPVYSPQTDLFGPSDNEKISSNIFSLINNSQDLELLKSEYNSHSDFTIRSFKSFVEEIYSSELKISLNWFSPESKNEFTDEIDYVKANLIKSNIETLSIEEKGKFTVIGKFRSLNCDTGHFSFVSTNSEKYNGFMDNLIKDGSERITFIDVYEITILRTKTKDAGKQESKIKDTILAFTIETA
jgi:hypothetical protein